MGLGRGLSVGALPLPRRQGPLGGPLKTAFLLFLSIFVLLAVAAQAKADASHEISGSSDAQRTQEAPNNGGEEGREKEAAK